MSYVNGGDIKLSEAENRVKNKWLWKTAKWLNETDRCSQELDFPRPLCGSMQPVTLLSLLYTGYNCVCAFSWRKQGTVATKRSSWKQFYPGRTSEVLISCSFCQELSWFSCLFTKWIPAFPTPPNCPRTHWDTGSGNNTVHVCRVVEVSSSPAERLCRLLSV